MNMYSYFKKCAASLSGALMVLAAAAGCSDELEVQILQPTEYLSFYVDMEPDGIQAESRGSVANVTFTEEEWSLMPNVADGENASRASVASSLSGNARVYAYHYNDGDAVKTEIKADYTFSGNLMTSETPQRWSDITGQKLEVYAYTPITETEIFKINADTGDPTIEYIINHDVAEQEDLIVANTSINDVAANERKPLRLTFKHALTAVRFKAGFDCTVKSIAIKDVYNKGTYAMWDDTGSGNWKWLDTANPSKDTYVVSFGDNGKEVREGEYIVTGDNTFILMPQTLPTGAKVILTLADRTLEIPLNHFVWDTGMMVTYTIYESEAPSYIYLDLAAGKVTITGKSYTGYRYSPDGSKILPMLSGTCKPNQQYYVYQSTSANRKNIWTAADAEGKEVATFKRPEYGDVIVASSGKSWKEYITNNKSVEDVIDNWTTAAAAALMQPTYNNYIDVTGSIGDCTINIDNVYTLYEQTHGHNQGRKKAGICFEPSGAGNKLTVDIIGDNRLGAIHYHNTSNNGNKLILKGNGSLTVADPQGKNSNWWNSVIGNNDNQNNCYGIQIDGGVIFSGSKYEEDCTAIGGGGNGTGEVTINGGVVTAVASTTGTAIGGGIGHNEPGGIGVVTINGGTVYAYNYKNELGIPVAAIGGAGSVTAEARSGTKIDIKGGTVYAESKHGPAIGGGGSNRNLGGDATIDITGGVVTAITNNINSCAIGGGTSYSNGCSFGRYNGGSATITISGNPVIRTGSIGGGITGDSEGKIGTAKINISGGLIQAQFLLAKGSVDPPTFNMTGGTIDGSLDDKRFTRKRVDGGAVYMEEGTFTLDGGTIQNCTGRRGGGIYIVGGKFTMTGGTICNCRSESDGGGIYMDRSSVEISGGEIYNNLAAAGNGGGIYIEGNDFHMSGSASLKDNSAINKGNIGGYGGAVYVFSNEKDVTVDLLSGSITGNTSEKKGGGVCVIINADYRAIVTVGTPGGGDENPLISLNHTLLQGAGLHVQGRKADITIESGKIRNNKVGAYVRNNDVSNEGGLVMLNGGDVTHNVVTFHANYAGADPASTYQNVVTATRSQLIAPALSRQGYDLDGWTTKADGTGVRYYGNDIVSIYSDLTLYANWVPK